MDCVVETCVVETCVVETCVVETCVVETCVVETCVKFVGSVLESMAMIFCNGFVVVKGSSGP